MVLICQVGSAELAEAQTKITDVVELKSQQTDQQTFKKTNLNKFGPFVQDLSGFESFDPVQSFLSQPYKIPEINFTPPTALINAGDRNGDGQDDMYATVVVSDETTSELSDRITKTLIYFSNSSQFPKLPDEIIREDLIPIGDINNDGFADSMVLDPEERLKIILEEPSLDRASLPVEVISGFNGIVNRNLIKTEDISNDQFDDAIFYAGNDSVAVVLGGQNIENIDYQLVGHEVLTGLDGNTVITVGDIESDGDPELLVVYNTASSNAARLAIFDFLDNGSQLENVMDTEISDVTAVFAQFARPVLQDLDNDSFKELILFNGTERVNDENVEHIFIYDDEGAQNGDLYNSTAARIINENFTIPVGDVDGNGNIDFVHSKDEEFLISELSSSYQITNSVTVAVDNELTEFLGFNNNLGDISGDFNGNGSNEIRFSYSRVDGASFGANIFEVDENRAITIAFSSEIARDEYSRKSIGYTANLGDLNGDGIEDVGVDKNNQFEIYWGGEGMFNSPDVVIDADTTVNFSSPATGDFNNDGFRDLVLVETPSRDMLFYYGSANFDSEVDKRIELEQIDPAFNESTPTVDNIGDINMDGIDDIIYSVVFIENRSFVILGGDNLSNTFDFEIPFESQVFANVGDIDQDGTPDFAMGDWDFQDESNSFTGAVRIYSGYDEAAGESFDAQTFYQLTQPLLDQDTGSSFSFFGFRLIEGDLNGDGITDLVASPFFHNNQNSGEGADAIFVYFGGENFDEQPDRSFPIPVEPVLLSGSDFSNRYQNSSGNDFGILPDINGDGSSELLTANTFPNPNSGLASHAYIFFGETTTSKIGEQEPAMLVSPNRFTSLGSVNNFINFQYQSAIGQFDGDQDIDILLAQRNDRNFLHDPLYHYELSTVVTTNIANMDTVGAQGGSVQDTTTGAKVDIPADALESDVEIEIGTFSTVPNDIEVSGQVIHLGPDGTQFSEPVTVTVPYDPDNLPTGINNESELTMLRYDGSLGIWESLETTIDTENKVLIAETLHFSGFAAGNKSVATSNEDDLSQDLPGKFRLEQNYPNPFNPTTTINYALPQASQVKLTVYDILGRQVATLVNTRQQAGTHSINFDASRLASGMYLYRIEAGSFTQTRKLMLVK